MSKIYDRIQKLQERKRNLDTGTVVIAKSELIKNATRAEKREDAVEYIEECVRPVSDEYTITTFNEAERVQNQLKQELDSQGISITFKHQGSITNGTHIKFYSDIDVLIIAEAFITLHPPLKVESPYKGNATNDLIEIRNITEKTLKNKYPQATVDCSGSKSISISGGSLRRKIDVVPSNWLDTEDYYRNTSDVTYRGVKILDISIPERVSNFPFLHNYRLNNKDGSSFGNLKRLIRLIKSIRSDADKIIGVSSYDIAGLCYNIPIDLIKQGTNTQQLLTNFCTYCVKLYNDESFKVGLMVPNGTRKLFDEKNGINNKGFAELFLESLELSKAVNS